MPSNTGLYIALSIFMLCFWIGTRLIDRAYEKRDRRHREQLRRSLERYAADQERQRCQAKGWRY